MNDKLERLAYDLENAASDEAIRAVMEKMIAMIEADEIELTPKYDHQVTVWDLPINTIIEKKVRVWRGVRYLLEVETVDLAKRLREVLDTHTPQLPA